MGSARSGNSAKCTACPAGRYTTAAGRPCVAVQATVSTLAGQSAAGLVNAAGSQAKFNEPWRAVVSHDTSFALVSDIVNHCVRKIVLATKAVSTVAGSSPGFADGVGTAAKFNSPHDLAIANDDSFALVADHDNYRVRRIDLATTAVSTLAGLSLIHI